MGLKKTRFIVILSLLQAIIVFAAKKRSTLYEVHGWTLPSNKTTLNPYDHVYTRLTCPSLVRFVNERGEGLLLKAPQIKVVNNKTIWILTVRKGIFWWDKKPLTAKNLKEFFIKNIHNIIYKKTKGVWKVPSFSSNVSGDQLTIQWDSHPEFGPYILSDTPLIKTLKSNKGLNYQCAGIYRPEKHQNGIYLRPNPKYSTPKPTLLFTQPSSSQKKHKTIFFEFAKSIEPNPRKRLPTEKSFCTNEVPTPYVSALIWKDNSKDIFSNPKTRELIHELLPLEFILRSGGAGYGQLIHRFSDLKSIKKSKKKLTRFAINFDKVNKTLDLMVGPKRKDNFRYHNSKIITCYLNTSQKHHILAMVLKDNLELVGIKCIISTSQTNFWNLKLVGMTTTYTNTSYISYFHSQRQLDNLDLMEGFLGDKILDPILVKYTQTLSFGEHKPDLLDQISSHIINKRQLMKLIVHHSACLKLEKNHIPRKINTQHPDWFRWFITKI